MPVVHHPELHVEKDVPEEHLAILPETGWVEGPAPDDWERDDFGVLIPLEVETPEEEPAKKSTKPAKSAAKAETKEDD